MHNVQSSQPPDKCTELRTGLQKTKRSCGFPEICHHEKEIFIRASSASLSQDYLEMSPNRRDVEFKTLDGLTLKAWFYPTASNSPCIIMSHGVRPSFHLPIPIY